MSVDDVAVGSVVVAVSREADLHRPLEWAARQAHLEGRRLVVVHVEPALSMRYPAGDLLADRAVMLARRAVEGLQVDAVSVTGSARRALVDISTRAHLLVLGSAGRGIFRSIMLGSVSARVATRASCPVIVVRPGNEAGPTAPVVVGADGTAESLPVIEFAFRQAELDGRPLRVVHCFWDAAVAAHLVGEAAVEDREEMQVLLARSVAGLREQHPDVVVSLELAHGLIDATLTGHPDRDHLLVVGRHPVETLGRRLSGAMATAVLESAHTAVAVVPEAAPASPAYDDLAEVAHRG